MNDDIGVRARFAPIEFFHIRYAFGDQQIRADFSINLVRRKNVVVGTTLPIQFPAEFIRIYPGA